MPSLPVNRIKKKNIMSYNGELCIVLECLVRTPPNNASYVQMELRSIKTGAKIPVRCGIGVSFEVFDNSIKSLEFSYEADGSYVFADTNADNVIGLTHYNYGGTIGLAWVNSMCGKKRIWLVGVIVFLNLLVFSTLC